MGLPTTIERHTRSEQEVLVERVVEWNEDSIAREFADEFGVDLDDVEVTDQFDHGVEWWEVEVNRRMYTVFEDEDDAREYAIGYLQDEFEMEPEILAGVAEWVINDNVSVYPTDIRLIAQEEGDRRVEDMGDEEAAEAVGMDVEYLEAIDDEDYAKAEQIGADAREIVAEEVIDDWKDGLKQDPLGFLADEHGIYTREELLSGKASFIQVDLDGVAKDIISNDGVANTLARYDGHENETSEGLIYYRTN